MLRNRVEAFTDFVQTYEAKLRSALTAALGSEVGREAAAEAMAYGWEHWDRVSALENPVGYLYQVGRNRGGRIHGKRQVLFPPSQIAGEPWGTWASRSVGWPAGAAEGRGVAAPFG